MTHLRTKRKPNLKNIFRLIFALILVFIMLQVVYSLGFVLKNKNNISKQVQVEKKDSWILNTTNTLTTNDGNKIFVELATSSESQEQGLSGKDILKEYNENGKIVTEGMLFVFDKLNVYTFWMKDMKFNLDMLWLDDNYNIVHIEKNAPADSYNPKDTNLSKIYSNDNEGHFKLAKYVLEINSNLSEKMNLKEGDKLNFN